MGWNNELNYAVFMKQIIAQKTRTHIRIVRKYGDQLFMLHHTRTHGEKNLLMVEFGRIKNYFIR